MTDNFGYFQGKHANHVLILGESHYGDEGGFKTEDVVNRYLTEFENGIYNISFEFFEKIAKSFGVNPAKERMASWNNVYFRNYICDKVCGIRDGKAKDQARNYRAEYNDVLFQFINEKKITTVFVFSRLVYINSLPSYYRKAKEDLGCCDNGTLMVGSRKDYISHCIYRAGVEHRFSGILLDHDVEFFGLRHPSSRCGFNPDNYKEILKEKLEKANR